MQFRILGPLEVVRDGKAVPLGRTQERSLLALLLLSANRVVSAERLAETLWDGHPPEAATSALQVYVSRLRKSLREGGVDGVLITQGSGYLARLEPDNLDAVRFESLVAQGRAQAAKGDHQSAATTFAEALALWRGEPLADLPEASFARVEAARLEEVRLSATEARIEVDLACGRHDELLAELEALIAAHPLRERFWAQRMVALYRAGRQAEALAAYRGLRRTLGDELGIEPGRPLRKLEAAVLRQDPSLDWSRPQVGVPTAPDPGERTRFVGRAPEKAMLSAALSRALQGTGGLVFISGEPGIGKTRLAYEVAAEAASRGMTVLAGHSYEMAGASPYVAFIEVLERAQSTAATPEAFLAEILGAGAPELARLVPRWRRQYPGLPAPLDLPPEQERRYLFACLSEVLVRLAKARPTLILLDDFQWADEPTLLFLGHLAPQLVDTPLLVVATYRDVEVGRPLAHTFEDLYRRRLAQRLTLGGISADEAGELIGSLTDQVPPPGLINRLYSQTEGNPFFLEEVLRDLVEQGHLFDQAGRFDPALDVADLGVPEGVRLVIGRRLERLTDDAQRLLASAAVAGRVFSVRLLRGIGALDLDRVLDVIDEAERAMLIGPAHGNDEYMFTHELIRQTLSAGLSFPRRQRAHLRAAEAMIATWAANFDEHSAEIAHHLAEAGDLAAPDQLFSYSLRAGHRALTTSAFAEALEHLLRAEALETHALPVHRGELFVALGKAHFSLNRWDEAISAWQRSLREYSDLGEYETVGRIAAETGFNLVYNARMEDGVAMLQDGLDALGERISCDRGRILASLGSTLVFAGQAVPGDGMLAEAREIADQLPDEGERGLILSDMAMGLFALMRFRDGADAGLTGVDGVRAVGDLWATASMLSITSWFLVGLGRFDESIAMSHELIPLAERLGHFPALIIDSRAQGMREFMQTGDLDRFDAFAHGDLQNLTDHLGGAWTTNSYDWLGHVAFLRGDWDGAGELFERAAKLAMGALGGFGVGARFHHLAITGRRDEALAFLAEHRAVLPTPAEPNTCGAWGMLLSCIEGLSVLDERHQCASWYPAIADAIETTGTIAGNYGRGQLLERVAGIAAAAGRDYDAAEGHFELALGHADRLPHQFERYETRRCYARMLRERDAAGDRDKADGLLREAVDGFTRLRMPRHAEMARSTV